MPRGGSRATSLPFPHAPPRAHMLLQQQQMAGFMGAMPPGGFAGSGGGGGGMFDPSAAGHPAFHAHIAGGMGPDPYAAAFGIHGPPMFQVSACAPP